MHSKVCLITRRSQGSVQYITQVGTGNYNEKTALQYTDLSLITADPGIGQDANHFFQNLAIGNVTDRYDHLLVAPSTLKTGIIRQIDREIAKRGDGRIMLKMNSITDVDLIEKLKQASCAGVRVRMIVRGICCILPGIPEKTENIEVISIVGRFLEHSRVYCFGQGSDERMFIASADFMTRNTEKRVEVACPIYDAAVRDKIHFLMDTCWADNVKARALQSDGTYCKRPVHERRWTASSCFWPRHRSRTIRQSCRRKRKNPSSSACMSYLNGDKTPQQSKMQTGSQTTGPGPCFRSGWGASLWSLTACAPD